MATRQKSLFDPKSVGLKAVAVVLVALVVVSCGAKLKTYSYDKLTPTLMELEVTALAAQNLMVDYDYGYGFNAAHRQVVRISVEPPTQVRRLTISTWKPILAVQVEAENHDTVTLQSATFKRGGDVVRISSPEPASGNLILLVQDFPGKFASAFADG